MSTKEKAAKSVRAAKQKSFEYPDKTIRIEVVERRRGKHIKDGPGASEASLIMGAGISRGLTLMRNGSFRDPFTIYAERNQLNADDIQEQLESDLQLSSGELNTAMAGVDSIMNSVWSKPEFKLTLRKKARHLSSAALILNLSQPKDFLLYLVALGCDYCAPDYDSRFKSNVYDFYIHDESVSQRAEVEIRKKRRSILTKIWGWADDSAFADKVNRKDWLWVTYNMLYTVGRYRGSESLSRKTPVDRITNEIESAANNQTVHLDLLEEIVNYDVDTLAALTALFVGRTRNYVRKQNGRYVIKGISLGTTPQEAAKWLLRDDNTDTLEYLQNLVNDSE